MQDGFDRIKEELGPPIFETDGILLYSGDSLELMRQLGCPRFALTVTSPPYNIGKEYEQTLAISTYLDWCSEWLVETARLTMPNGAFWLNVGYVPLEGRAKALPIPYLLWDRVPMFLVQEIVWSYGAGVAARKSFSPRNEKFLWYVNNPNDYVFNLDAVRDPDVKYPNQKKNGKLKCNPLGKNPTDVWRFPKVTSGMNRSSKERTPHPAQFPKAVIDRIIKACSNPGDVILDPFMGSGTVAEIAALNGRRAVGFEISPEYVEISVERLKKSLARRDAETSQQHLFA